jgi:hypothetical protein
MVLMDSTLESLTPSVNTPSKKKRHVIKKNYLGIKNQITNQVLTMRSKLLMHFMKGGFHFPLVEMIITMPGDLEYFGGFGQAGMRDSNKASRSAGCGEI